MKIEPDDKIVTVALSAYREHPLPESTSYVLVWTFDHRERMAAALNAVVYRFEASYEATHSKVFSTEQADTINTVDAHQNQTTQPTDTEWLKTSNSSRELNPLIYGGHCETTGCAKAVYVILVNGRTQTVLKCAICPFEGGCSR